MIDSRHRFSPLRLRGARAARILAAVLLAVWILVPPVAVGREGVGIEGELYIIGSCDSERIERVEFHYNGQQFNVASPRCSHDLTGGGSVDALPDSLRERDESSARRRIRRVTTNADGEISLSKRAAEQRYLISIRACQDRLRSADTLYLILIEANASSQVIPPARDLL